MVIKYCPNCSGRPYTTNLEANSCPQCGTSLGIESVDNFELEERTQLCILEEDSYEEDAPSDRSHYENDNTDLDATPFPKVPTKRERKSNPFIFGNNISKEKVVPNKCIRGKISQYSSTGKEDGEYRRLFPVKLYQALVYKQRLEDVLHRFTVRVEQGEDALGYQEYTDIPVNVHGTISGGLQLVDNAEVEVQGKYCNGVLMADSVYIINNGYKSKVGFQHSVKGIVYGVLAALLLLFICILAAGSNGNFFANIKEFCTTWLIITGILMVLYFILSFSRFGILTRMFSKNKRSFPLVGILITALVLTILFISTFGSFAGFGSFLSGLFSAIVPIIIVIVILFFIIKGLF